MRIKDVIAGINRKKFDHPGDELLVILNPDIYLGLDAAGLIVRWQTNYSGTPNGNETVCGLTCVRDKGTDGYLVLTKDEYMKKEGLLSHDG